MIVPTNTSNIHINVNSVNGTRNKRHGGRPLEAGAGPLRGQLLALLRQGGGSCAFRGVGERIITQTNNSYYYYY